MIVARGFGISYSSILPTGGYGKRSSPPYAYGILPQLILLEIFSKMGSK